MNEGNAFQHCVWFKGTVESIQSLLIAVDISPLAQIAVQLVIPFAEPSVHGLLAQEANRVHGLLWLAGQHATHASRYLVTQYMTPKHIVFHILVMISLFYGNILTYCTLNQPAYKLNIRLNISYSARGQKLFLIVVLQLLITICSCCSVQSES